MVVSVGKAHDGSLIYWQILSKRRFRAGTGVRPSRAQQATSGCRRWTVPMCYCLWKLLRPGRAHPSGSLLRPGTGAPRGQCADALGLTCAWKFALKCWGFLGSVFDGVDADRNQGFTTVDTDKVEDKACFVAAIAFAGRCANCKTRE